MKYSPKKYAKALMEAIREKNTDEKDIIDNFIKLLEKNNDLAKFKEILEIAKRSVFKRKIVFEIARKAKYNDILENFVKKGDMIEKKINPELAAGIRITIDDLWQLDMSMLGEINKLFDIK